MANLQIIQSKIYEVRGQKVMLDFDLAELYGIETRYLNKQSDVIQHVLKEKISCLNLPKKKFQDHNL